MSTIFGGERRLMSDRSGRPHARPGVIIRPSREGVFSELMTPNGGSVTVMSREVYAKASKAAGAEIRKVSREGSAGVSFIVGTPPKGVR